MNKIEHQRARVFKTKPFARFSRKNRISDEDLCGAVHSANRGLIDADLGAGVIKQRLARRGSGKSGGFRVLIVLRTGRIAIFVHGFAKNDLGNIDAAERQALKKLADELLAYGAQELAEAIVSGNLVEVNCNGSTSEAIS